MSETLRKIANERKAERLIKDIESSKGCKLFGVHFDATAIYYYAKDRADVTSLILEESEDGMFPFQEKGDKLYVIWDDDYHEEVNIEEIPVVRGHVFSVSH